MPDIAGLGTSLQRVQLRQRSHNCSGLPSSVQSRWQSLDTTKQESSSSSSSSSNQQHCRGSMV